ncbi:aminoglycoside phosphotransferase [Amylibacter marinus]|uniref:Aminoglycoside phosphotransferase n=1 Tax=Amylibacter marinus TaxID=1475483 RepID=A0ABQ5VWE7_9RHOB|nr:phosphotransferase [Amylibacter marinus]GLQ35617.1 aminoglycoside phosphotransferase [Amylibacter marinus]
MNSRATAQQNFLASTPWANAEAHPLMADASGRRYTRLILGADRAMLMDAPYEAGEDVRPFVAITQQLRGAGLSAPEIIAQDIDQGFLLLEDLGDGLFSTLCRQTPAQETSLYGGAVDALLHLHSTDASGPLPYDMATYQREASLLTQWYMPAAGVKVLSSLEDSFSEIISNACTPILDQEPVLVLRDYHADNLLWLPQRRSVARVGMLDYQDALMGHPAYDLVSLLEDARRDTSPVLRQAMITRYLSASGLDEKTFTAAYNILGMQRNIKILGIFTRLCIRDAKAHYVDLIPRVWGHLMRDLSHPSCAPMRQWFADHVPAPDTALLTQIKAQA